MTRSPEGVKRRKRRRKSKGLLEKDTNHHKRRAFALFQEPQRVINIRVISCGEFHKA